MCQKGIIFTDNICVSMWKTVSAKIGGLNVIYDDGWDANGKFYCASKVTLDCVDVSEKEEACSVQKVDTMHLQTTNTRTRMWREVMLSHLRATFDLSIFH